MAKVNILLCCAFFVLLKKLYSSMIQPTAQSAPKMLDTLSAPFPTEEHPVVDDLPPLKLPTYISNETKKHVMQRVDKYLALHYSKKRQRELENEGDKDIAKKLKTTERETPISAVRSIPTTPAKATPPPMTTFQSPRRRSTLSNTPTARTSVTERPLQPPSPSPLRRSMTPRLHAASSPFSYISEKVSPLSSSFPDYCEQVVNQMMEQFQEQRTPDNIGILSPIDNRSVVSGRLSMISQSKSMRATSPHTRKLSVFSRTEGPTPYIKESKGRKADTPESSLWDYYESKGGTNVYQNSPSLRPTRPSPAISRRARTSFVDTEQLASPSGVSPAASSLYAYREAIEEQDNAGPGLLDETEPDMFYTSDFTIQS
ncbi:hypothetical protein BDB00DRAFT_481749 [Zychaea mexicana]|uniref:uncharacterized protein n=1 Tax=Zychaea mexicana TaxID=64656 RepID=UPI0022FE794B|nr:uncharacterized protein BDB00DRAFT_481749 [Zychaea mexicana]KAI9491605.1 hypothetical protein BDB00DRAFT_481749 [Zychaea mexicana]